ncbi:hypothetical protein BOTBODRAFT_100797 [Botryobasidium botryosum FD-172 SS1]|uniref:Protein-serine/threonine kinase n=1 Tax=Botryobasidium botryosum (strain FD-172 SS1) TaxID=930990 RepID=A0A067MZ35_BOTB1|nr:hypothetical protein BOTBODRAFT_100797 [Botryobasidium botryosum FD-172 SS1]
MRVASPWPPARSLRPSSAVRLLSSTTASYNNFYRNRQLERYAARETRRLSLRQLVFFGRSMNEERLIKSANYVRTELPVRIAHRIRDLQALPYVVVTQPDVAKVYELYWTAFEKRGFVKSLYLIRRYPQINTTSDNEKFCNFLGSLLSEHSGVIPALSLGLSLSSPHLPPDQLDSFMRRMLVTRISRRVLVDHHVALSRAVAKHGAVDSHQRIGIIYPNLDVKACIMQSVKHLKARPLAPLDITGIDSGDIPWPDVVIDGHVDTTFAYIKEHFDYMVFELLKNSMRFTRMFASRHRPNEPLPPIRATIVAGPDDIHLRISDNGGGITTPKVSSPEDLYSFSHVRNRSRLEGERLGALRDVSSSGRGMTATFAEQLADITPAGVSKPDKIGRIGLGLPMSNIYATYFGGSLDLMSLDGWGTDVYLRLPKLGTNLEGIDI